jgi:hypothetical protein
MGHNVVPSILGGLAGLAAATVGAPWWCIVLIAGIALVDEGDRTAALAQRAVRAQGRGAAA